MRKFKWIFILALLGAIAAGSGVWAADYANLSIDTLKVLDTAYVKTINIGGDPKAGTAGTTLTEASLAEMNTLNGLTASSTELNYLDIAALGTGAASKAVVLTAGDDYTWPATGILTYGVLKDSAGTTITATGAEVNYLDITTLGTGAASKAVVLDAGDDYTWPATGILTYGVLKDPAGTTLTSTVAELNILDNVTAAAAELNYLDITTLGTGAASKAVVLDAGDDYTWPATGVLKLGVVKDVADTTLTSTFAELNALASAGLSAAEATVLGGIGAGLTASELDILDGVTATAGELNYNDVTAAGTAEASKSAVLDASKSITGLGPIGVTGDVTLTQGNNGTGNDVNAFVGVPKMAPFAIGASVNGTVASHTVGPLIYIDETPAAEWVAVDGDCVSSTESTIFRKGTASLKLAFADTAAADDGAANTLAGGDQDWTDDESIGMWIYSTATLASGDLALKVSDSGPVLTDIVIPAVATANTWTWVELDISGLANASKDVVDAVSIVITTQGATALGATTVYCDFMAKWDGADEETLGLDVQQDGVVGLWATVTDAGQANTPVVLAEGTDYIIHYQTGNDAFIAVTDQSANSIWGFAATN